MLFIIGMSRAGKTEIGKTLAERNNTGFFDTDAELEKKYGIPVSDVYKILGEKGFRCAETDILKKTALRCENKDTVICTGGGIAENAEAAAFLKNSKRSVLIDTDAEIIFARIKKENEAGKGFPKFLGENLNNEEKAAAAFYAVYNRRIKIYRKIAAFIFLPDFFSLSPQAAAEAIEKFFLCH